MLYKHFKRKLEKQIEEFGHDRMKRSIEELKRLRKKVHITCILGGDLNKGTGEQIWNKRVVALKVKEDIEECQLMQMSEINLLKIVSAHQRAFYKYRFLK